jgi:hypothetical protein
MGQLQTRALRGSQRESEMQWDPWINYRFRHNDMSMPGILCRIAHIAESIAIPRNPLLSSGRVSNLDQQCFGG